MTIIGIDLGTTNSLVSVWQGNRALIIPNSLGQLLTPSVVSVLDNGNVLVGQAAKDRLISHPAVTVSQFKRLMGTREEIRLGKQTFTPETLSSLVLRQLKEDAEVFLGEPVSEAIISVPAYFNDNQRTATRLAGQLAGLTVDRLINEPTAAALAYGVAERQDEQTFIVLDLGGGTFDVSILEKFENMMEVHASAGDSFLGGEDFTDLLVNDFCTEHKLDRDGLARSDLARIYKATEVAKRQVDSGDVKTVSVNIDDIELTYELKEERLVQVCEPLLNRLLAPIERAIRDANIRTDDINRIFLVGGATRLSLVRSLATRLFGRFPEFSIDPDQAVALGAAVQGALKQRDKDLDDVVLTDVCPFSLGIGMVNNVFSVIIERNMVVPVSRVSTYNTVQDQQDRILIPIYQGEHRLTDNNIKLGELEISVPRKKAGEAMVDVRFTYDINGLLEAIVTSQDTGKSETLVIENSETRLSESDIKKALAKLEHIKLHPRDDVVNRTLMARAERLYQERLGDERERIAMLIAEFEKALDTQDSRTVTRAATQFKELLDELETSIW